MSGLNMDPMGAVQQSLAYVTHLAEGRAQEAYLMQDGVLALVMSTVDLADLWRQMTALIGRFESVTASEIVDDEGSEEGIATVYLRCRFERSELGVKLDWHSDGYLSAVQFYRADQGYTPG